MKKNFLIFGTWLLCLSLLTACAGMYGAAGSVYSGPAPESYTSAVAVPDAVTYAVGQTIQEDSALAEDGTVLAKCHYELPDLHALRADGSEITEAKTADEKQAMSKVSGFNEKFEEWAADANFGEIADWAREDFKQSPEQFQENGVFYLAELSFTSWQTEHLISVAATYDSFTGGAHPNAVLLSWNFDLDAGVFIEPTVVAEDRPAFLNAVEQEIVRQAVEKAAAENLDPTEAYWENYRQIIADWSSYAVAFHEDGMTVGFSPYELASYAAGPQTFTLSNDFLEPYLSDYGKAVLDLPAEQGGGTDAGCAKPADSG